MGLIHSRAAAWGLCVATLGLLAPARSGVAQSRAARTSSRPAPATHPAQETPATTREEALWQRIRALTQPVPATQPYEKWFAAAQGQRGALLGRVQLYLTLYPGGTHRDEAVRLELSTLFELGTLGDRGLGPLSERVAAYLQQPPSQAVLEEAAYWEILCRRWADTTELARPRAETGEPAGPRAGANQAGERPASAPTSAPALVADARLLAAYRDYVARYPRSRYVPRMASLLFDDAARRADRDAMRDIVAALRASFPDHALTAALEGQWQCVQAVGRPFWLTFQTADNRQVDTRTYQGAPVLIVVWAGFDAGARACVQSVERFRAAYPNLRVVGVNLDDTAEQAAAAARKLAVSWPQFCDGLGWGGEFVRTWGVRHIPLVFVVDRDGRLIGSAGEEGWEALTREALRPAAPATSQPAG